MPVAMEKSEGPATCLTFLGIELDSSLQQLRLSLTKLQDITSLTKSWLGKWSSTKRELLSLIGKLAFAAKVVPAGRLFLHRLIHLSTTVRRLHHRIRLTQMPELMLHGGIGFCHPGMVSHVYCSRLERCRLHQSIHRRIRFPRDWCIFRSEAIGNPLTTTSLLHTVAGAMCHCGCSTHMGVPSVRATHTIPLR